MTAVEWLVNLLNKQGFEYVVTDEEIEQAKEKEQQDKLKAQIEILRECGYDERDTILKSLLNQLNNQ
jgi:hypothetical protein